MSAEATYASRIWIAGQRIDPTQPDTSPFIWRAITRAGVVEMGMNYTNWNAGEPNNWNGNESCIIMILSRNYKWHDANCAAVFCYVCEIDL